MVNCQWLFSKYMIRRVPRITINHWQLTINLSFRAKRRISFLFSTRFLTMFGMTNTVLCVRIPCTRYVCPHGAQGLQARYISAPSRKGGVSMSAPCLEGWKPDIISFLSLLAWPKSNPKVKASCASHTARTAWFSFDLLAAPSAHRPRPKDEINCQWLIVNCYFLNTWFGVYHA